VQKEDCFSLGKITKLHGYKGGIILHIDSSTPQYFKELESVFLEINQELVPFFFAKRGKLNGKKMVIVLEDVDPDEASRLVGCSAYLPQSMLPQSEDDDSFYDKAIIGFRAIDVNNGDNIIGVIEDIIENTAQNLFVIVNEEREFYIPVVDAFISRIDNTSKFVYLDLPEGLLDL
jgi:16S rRNA processing protein RimM